MCRIPLTAVILQGTLLRDLTCLMCTGIKTLSTLPYLQGTLIVCTQAILPGKVPDDHCLVIKQHIGGLLKWSGVGADEKEVWSMIAIHQTKYSGRSGGSSFETPPPAYRTTPPHRQ